MDILRLGALSSALAYLAWRAAFTWSGAHPVLFVALLLAEAFGVARLWVELRLSGSPRPIDRDPVTVPAPATDIVVVVNDEPTSEVRAALVSAKAVRGVDTVLVVDRTDRLEINELTERLDVERLTSSDSDGDLGYLLTTALGATTSPLFAIVPADAVALPDLIEVTAVAFEDPEVAVALARTEATNAAHPVDHGGYGADAQRDLVVVPLLDDAHSLPWRYGASVARRDALEEIGGFASGRIQPTLATGVRLHVAGWRMADLPVYVARRLAPWTESRHLHRWARDLRARLELARRGDISWSSTRITPTMRLAYAAAAFPGLRSIQRVVLLAVLAATIAGVGLPLVAPGALFIGFWSLRMGLGLAARRRAGRSFWFIPWITVDLQLLATELTMLVNMVRRRDEVELVDPAPGLVWRTPMFNVLLLSLAAPIALHGFGVVSAPYDDLAMLITFAVLAWLFAAVVFARESPRLRQRRKGFRAATDVSITGTGADMKVVGISPLGIDVLSSNPLWVGAPHHLDFELPSVDDTTACFEASTIVRHSEFVENRHTAFLRFAQMSDEETDHLIEFSAVVAGEHLLRGPELEPGDSPVGLSVTALDDEDAPTDDALEGERGEAQIDV